MNKKLKISLAIPPASRKVYIQGSRPDIQVPMREISLTDTPDQVWAAKKNLPLMVYDTSGAIYRPNMSRLT